MYLEPEDWREWVWDARNVSGSVRDDRSKLWRVTASGGAAGGTIAFGDLEFNIGVSALAANQVVVFEPRGMCPFVVVTTGDVTAIVEFIRKAPTA